VLLAGLAMMIGFVVPSALPQSAPETKVAAIPLLSVTILPAAVGLISIASISNNTAQISTAIVAAVLVIGWFVRRERYGCVCVLPQSTYSGGSPLKWIYRSILGLAMGPAAEGFAALFGQRLAGLEPLVAGVPGRRGLRRLVGHHVLQCQRVPAHHDPPDACRRPRRPDRRPHRGRAAAARPRRPMAGRRYVPRAGSGRCRQRLAFPHQLVAVMRSTPDPAEGGKASAGINTVETIGVAFGSAFGGLMINLGAGAHHAALVGCALFGLTPRGRRFYHDKIWTFIRSAGTAIAEVTKSPRHLTLTGMGALGGPIVQIVVLWLCAHALGGELPFAQDIPGV
jgi:hypothetical protein